MGLFDSVYADCPHCGKPVEFQSKADECPYMNRYNVADAPTHILIDVLNRPQHCMSCGGWMALVDPRYPPGHLPRPDAQPVKVRTPENPQTHFQGMKWWPTQEPFSFDDIREWEPLTSEQHP